MRCYFTGEECDCDGDMDTECPHDAMDQDIFDDPDEFGEVEAKMADMSERLDACQSTRR